MVDSLERFMHKAYLGQKQFSIEGLDMTVPMLDEMIQLSAANGAREVVIGMAHRGRLNVLAHNLGRAYETIWREFEGASSIEAVTTIPQGGTGDVKYHHGAQGTYQLPDDQSVIVRLESNPSHLEYVSPVVEGATRAVQTSRQGPHAHIDNNAAIPIILHGDAAFPAQGVVAETLNLQALDGYQVGGSLHLIQNNQVGFTTDPEEARSTRWASDLAKGFDVPIIHVNADDVAACVAAVRLALRVPPGVRPRRRHRPHRLPPLGPQRGRRARLHAARDGGQDQEQDAGPRDLRRPARQAGRDHAGGVRRDREGDLGRHGRAPPRAQGGALARARPSSPPAATSSTARPRPRSRPRCSADRLVGLNEDLLAVPEGFNVHPKLLKQLERRRETIGPDGGIDWAHAEALAFASLLSEGTPVRLTGQDVERGTFSQRHLVLHDVKTGQRVSPIQSLPGALAPMELHNSPLSEIACLGFEYGYSMEAPETLVLWEAQFGDFINSAQVIVDQFIISALAKWGQTTRLTLLLPHGYEGSGPEHSSARLERFLTLAAEGNMRDREPDDAGAVLPPAAPPGARRQAAPADHHDPEVAAAAAAGDLADRAPVGVALLPGPERAADRRGEGHPPRPLLGQGLLRPQGPRHAREQRGRRDLPRRAALPLPAEPDRGGDRALPEPARGRLGPGGAAQHGRPRAHVAAPAADAPLLARVRLHRPPRARLAGRGLPGRPHAWSRPASSGPPWISRSRCPSTRPRRRASASRRPARRAVKRNPGGSRVSQWGTEQT